MSELKSLDAPDDAGFDMPAAVAEAGRCLLCHEPPCSKGCPADTDPGTFIRKLRLRNITGAIRTIKTNNILGGVCGVLCPAARLCEKECSASGIDTPIRIARIQRFLVEHAARIGFKPLEAPASREKGADKARVAVVGAGPAGLSCAAELAKAGVAVTVFEARPEPGGAMRYGVPAFRLSRELLRSEVSDVKALGVEIKCSSPISGRGAAEKLLKQGYRAVFLCPGLWGETRLEAGPRPAKGLYASVDFLATLAEDRRTELRRKIKGRACGVIGGGSVAIDCCRSALRLGASDVYLIYRRSYAQMPAEEDEKVSALREGTHLLALNQPVEYLGDASGNLKGIRLCRTTLGTPDTSGRRRPQAIAGSEWTLDLQVVIEAIGNKPVDDARGWYPTVAVREGGLIKALSADGRTSNPAMFAGGDIVRGPGLVVQAVQDGKAAAAAILDHLSRKRGPCAKERVAR
ncbi:MAG: FAD-dependent oxidoreductase [Elusimicrobia bacterium]|nr:FAD-dependent oxidoreductase [Elusimicrobiota bacterium]